MTKRDRELIVGNRISEDRQELDHVVASVIDGSIPARKRDVTKGDVRYWGVDVTKIPVLQRLKEFGEQQFVASTGKRPVISFVMVNHIDAKTCPVGSGDGWHRDSYEGQFKAFAYLTDVESTSQGAFCYLPQSNSMIFRLPSLMHRVVTGGHRYRESTIQRLIDSGVKIKPVLLGAGIPFFVSTSLIHRGLPITEGKRVMAAVYMFDNPKIHFNSPDFVDPVPV